MMDVRIYRPAKTATQSGRAKTRRWVLEYAPRGKREVDDLMGWTSSNDTTAQVRLSFATEAEAIAYAKRRDLNYVVDEPRSRRVRPKSYADNFIRKT
jgi:hypothetical protein